MHYKLIQDAQGSTMTRLVEVVPTVLRLLISRAQGGCSGVPPRPTTARDSRAPRAIWCNSKCHVVPQVEKI